MEPISALAVMMTLAAGVGAGIGGVLLRRPSAEQVLVDGALRHASMADLQRRLTDDGVVVRVTYVDSLFGARLWLDASDVTATVRLFRSVNPSWKRVQGSAAVLRLCEYRDTTGWNIVLDTLEGRRHTTGWRVDVTPRREPVVPQNSWEVR